MTRSEEAIELIGELLGYVDEYCVAEANKAASRLRALIGEQEEVAPPGRLETGVVQCGDDWPGVFVRGDDATRIAMTLSGFLDGDYRLGGIGFEDQMREGELVRLRDFLTNANVHEESHPTPQFVTRAHPVSPSPRTSES